MIGQTSLANCVHSVGLIEFGFSRPALTWNNGKKGIAIVKRRLDRGLCNSNWKMEFLEATFKHLVHTFPSSSNFAGIIGRVS